jgi:hypothetical protein
MIEPVFENEETWKFISCIVLCKVNDKIEETPLTNFPVPENFRNIEKFLRQSFYERMKPIINACKTKKLKEELSQNVLACKFKDIKYHESINKTYSITIPDDK